MSQFKKKHGNPREDGGAASREEEEPEPSRNDKFLGYFHNPGRTLAIKAGFVFFFL
jgi:hypothetical protein